MDLDDKLDGLKTFCRFYPQLSKITGNLHASLLLSKLISWTGLQKDIDGWIYKTAKELKEETGLTPGQQRRARKILLSKGLISTKLAGIPAKMNYKFEIEAFEAAWAAHGYANSYNPGNKTQTLDYPNWVREFKDVDWSFLQDSPKQHYREADYDGTNLYTQIPKETPKIAERLEDEESWERRKSIEWPIAVPGSDEDGTRRPRREGSEHIAGAY